MKFDKRKDDLMSTMVYPSSQRDQTVNAILVEMIETVELLQRQVQELDRKLENRFHVIESGR